MQWKWSTVQRMYTFLHFTKLTVEINDIVALFQLNARHLLLKEHIFSSLFSYTFCIHISHNDTAAPFHVCVLCSDAKQIQEEKINCVRIIFTLYFLFVFSPPFFCCLVYSFVHFICIIVVPILCSIMRNSNSIRMQARILYWIMRSWNIRVLLLFFISKTIRIKILNAERNGHLTVNLRVINREMQFKKFDCSHKLVVSTLVSFFFQHKIINKILYSLSVVEINSARWKTGWKNN